METSQSLNDPRIQALIEVLGPAIPTGSGEIRFASPFREHFKNPNKEDRGKHLYVNVRKGKFFCQKSSIGGSLSYLFFTLGLDKDSLKEAPVDLSLDSLKSRLLSLDKPETFVKPIAELPEWSIEVVHGSEVHRYLRQRGVSDEDVNHYRIREGTGDYHGWVVIPSFSTTGTCEYWVCRNTRKKTYLNPEVDRRYHVGFLNTALACSPGFVVVCEGMFSAIVAGRNAVAAFGKFVTNDQLRTMWDAGVRKVALALDGDAWEETLDTAERCIKIGLETVIVPLPLDEDPADLGRERFKVLLETSSIPVDSTSLLKLKLSA